MKPTDKKNITVKFTAREASWLYEQLEQIKRTNQAIGATPLMQAQAFMALSLQDRIDSES